ncbi:MAG TPA: FAD-binding oxidoreductase [Thermomicrobiaceae bacterium]|nr:FAD-binding oxidoreductase [Thermomicrobiaceae bacterium]
MVTNQATGAGKTTSALQTLGFRGDVIQPGDAGYDAARKVWNAMIDKRPALIALCTGTADVVAAVNVARDFDLPVAVRGGGHNVAGNAVNEGGLVIDLSRMKGIAIDPRARKARVQPGADWGELDRETQIHGLVTPGGQMSATGVAGFTLGGGMGFLRRKWGLACDNLVRAEVVTADGEVLTASEQEHPDLLWALRGGGGNFGVVTSFGFQLHPLGPEVSCALVIYPIAQTAEVMRRWRDYLAQAPDEVTCDLLIWGMPPLPMVPPELHWAPVVIAAAMYAGPVDAGERALQPVREFGTPIADMSSPRPYVVVQSDLDPLFPDSQLYYWKSLFGSRLSDEIITAIATLGVERPSPQTLIALRGLGGAMGRVPEEATAYGNRDARYNLSIDSTWQDPAESERNMRWTRASWAAMRELTGGGVYLNFAGLGEENDLLARAGYGCNYERLKTIKQRYDPANFFRGNINIAP